MIPLDKGLIVKLYSYLCQAQRSLHRAVCNNWSDFQNYYRPHRARGVGEAVAALDESISGRRSSPMPDKEDIFKKLPRIGILRYYLGGWLARWKHSFVFTPQEISYTAGKLEAFLELLARPSKPSTDELVDLRMDLSVAEGILNCRCFGLEEFKRARRIEHFDRTEWYPHLQLWEILGERPRLSHQRRHQRKPPADADQPNRRRARASAPCTTTSSPSAAGTMS